MFGKNEEEKKIEKFLIQLETDIHRDEGTENNGKKPDGVQSQIDEPKPISGVSLFDLLGRLGGGDKPSLFIIQKIRSTIVNISAKGLSDENKKLLHEQTKILANNDEYKAELLMQAIRESGYDLDANVPTLVALGILFAWDAIAINRMTSQFKKDDKDKQEINSMGVM